MYIFLVDAYINDWKRNFRIKILILCRVLSVAFSFCSSCCTWGRHLVSPKLCVTFLTRRPLSFLLWTQNRFLLPSILPLPSFKNIDGVCFVNFGACHRKETYQITQIITERYPALWNVKVFSAYKNFSCIITCCCTIALSPFWSLLTIYLAKVAASGSATS